MSLLKFRCLVCMICCEKCKIVSDHRQANKVKMCLVCIRCEQILRRKWAGQGQSGAMVLVQDPEWQEGSGYLQPSKNTSSLTIRPPLSHCLVFIRFTAWETVSIVNNVGAIKEEIT